jgi:hypothetical protein
MLARESLRWAAPLSTEHRFGRALRVGAVGAFIGAAIALGIPVCPFAVITHHPCPGCGLTRATLALMRGHFTEAARFHPLVFVMAPLVIAGALTSAYSFVTKGTVGFAAALSRRWATRAFVVLCMAMIALWIARFFGAWGGPVPV